MSTDTIDMARAAAELDAAQEAMRAAVKAARADGRPIPCISDDAGLWLSERARERAQAARKCVNCPVLGECERLACGAEFGVWAGKDYTAPPPAEKPRLPVNPEARLRVLTADPERRDERNQLVYDLHLHNAQVWSTRALMEATGLSWHAVRQIIRTGGRTASVPRGGRDQSNQARRRIDRIRAEVDALDHPIVNQLRQHADRPGTVQGWERDRRNELLLQLARSGPWWTFERLAAAASMSTAGALKAVKTTADRHDGTVQHGTIGNGRTTHIRSAE
jgi:hypothetical protein